MDSTWVTTVLLGFILSYVFYWIYKRYNYWDEHGLPNVKSIPFLGMAMNLLIFKNDLNTLVLGLYKGLAGHRFGGYMQIATPGIFVRDPDLINRIMITDFSYFEDRSLPRKTTDLLGEALPGLTGNKWRHARHKLTPTFTSGKLKNMFDTIKRCSEHAADHLSSKTSQDIESRDLLFKFVLSVVADVAFGLKLDAYNPESQENNDFLKVCSKIFNPSFPVMMKILIVTTSPKLGQALNISVTDKEVDNYFHKLVKDLIKHREKTGTRRNDFLQLMLDERQHDKQASTNHHSTSSHETEEPEDKDLIQQLKNMGSPDTHEFKHVFTDEFMASQSFVFLSGGTENTSAILGFTLFELASHPSYQKRVQEDIQKAVANGFDYQSLAKMTYLDQFLYETFRLYPPASVLFRICTKDYQVPDSNFVIKKGTLIMIPPIALHKDPQYFENPEIFNPDRFEDMSTIRRGTFFSFGGGPRMCIAMRFALLEIKVFLATILLRYNVALSAKTKLPIKLAINAISPRVEGGIWLKFEKRA